MNQIELVEKQYFQINGEKPLKTVIHIGFNGVMVGIFMEFTRFDEVLTQLYNLSRSRVERADSRFGQRLKIWTHQLPDFLYRRGLRRASFDADPFTSISAGREQIDRTIPAKTFSVMVSGLEKGVALPTHVTHRRIADFLSRNCKF